MSAREPDESSHALSPEAMNPVCADKAFRCLKCGVYLGISGDECDFFQNLRVILRAAVVERIDVWRRVLKLI